MKKNIILIIGVLIATSQIQAQSFGQKLTGGLNISFGIPSGEFKELNNNTAIGGKGWIAYNPSRNIPLYLGIEIGYGVMGQRTQYFYSTVYGFYDEYEVAASSNILSLHIKMRLQQPKLLAVRPFAEGILGWNDFFSTVNVERITYNGYYDTRGGNSSGASWAFTYGGAAGLNIILSRKDHLFLELKTAYMVGRKATYLTDPQITNQGQVYFTENKSETNMIIPQIGVKLGL